MKDIVAVEQDLCPHFVEAVRTNDQACLDTHVTEVLKSYLTVFAAESSRKEGKVVDCVEPASAGACRRQAALGNAYPSLLGNAYPIFARHSNKDKTTISFRDS